MDDGDAGSARGASQLGAVLHDAAFFASAASMGKADVFSDHAVLDLLQHERGVSGRDQFVQVEWHGDR